MVLRNVGTSTNRDCTKKVGWDNWLRETDDYFKYVILFKARVSYDKKSVKESE